jgi:hypothetical protein
MAPPEAANLIEDSDSHGCSSTSTTTAWPSRTCSPLRRPERVLGLIVQNGSAHDEGMDKTWDTTRAFWADPSPENRAKLPDWLNFEGVRETYVSQRAGASTESA